MHMVKCMVLEFTYLPRMYLVMLIVIVMCNDIIYLLKWRKRLTCHHLFSIMKITIKRMLDFFELPLVDGNLVPLTLAFH